ncbi:hypothetical protein PV379_31700 [Streptomyces caniscabiei]|uniref:hypothetical protein n=1 Tax=Streptomyces caniscabiei TaxID=2746961 RepID=UPI0029BB6EB7|nr:hypothetical protein [Streptomyces caniscabiei]MDX2602868.1 hypothetical protein [Streptomyces caniscabiei]MDX2737845.1 hypothetical protein [Streptomyces caniscabiei]MDX2781834.1 hypothetical protein [Streptomyces caniscabiei]
MVATTALLTTSTPVALAVATSSADGFLPVAQGLARAVSAAAIGLGRRLRPEYRTARGRVGELRVRAREPKNPAASHHRLEKEIRKPDDARGG